ncbi:hypothetical protein [Streptomyces sp. SAS_270]|uniref:hypothetical protein n=1 Tax=Streptomyces sp. SAS_270 TaxID=3412748 RepID=UPI00403C7266
MRMQVRRSANEALPYMARLMVINPIYAAFDGSGTPGQGESGGDGVEVLPEEAGEALHGLRCVLLGLSDPIQQKVSALVADQVCEGEGEVSVAVVVPILRLVDRTGVPIR